VSPSERERVDVQVRDSRRRQGKTERIQDAAVLDALAARVLADVRREHNDAPGSPGRRSTARRRQATERRDDPST
jgi:hypothetical protein